MTSQNERTPQSWLSRLLSRFTRKSAVPQCPICGSEKLEKQGYEDKWVCRDCREIVVPEVK